MNFLVYRSDGTIVRTGWCLDEVTMLLQAGSAEVVIENLVSATQATHYVVVGPPVVVTEFPAMSTAIDKTFIAMDGSETATISGVPAGAALYVDGVLWGTISDGTAEYASTAPGTHLLRLTHYRYLPSEFTVYVGIIAFPAGGEVETGSAMTTLLPLGGEAEAGQDAVADTTVELEIGGEAEAGEDLSGSVTVELDAGGEVEAGGGMAALLEVGGEVETGGADADIELGTAEGGEVESGYDIAA